MNAYCLTPKALVRRLYRLAEAQAYFGYERLAGSASGDRQRELEDMRNQRAVLGEQALVRGMLREREGVAG